MIKRLITLLLYFLSFWHIGKAQNIPQYLYFIGSNYDSTKVGQTSFTSHSKNKVLLPESWEYTSVEDSILEISHLNKAHFFKLEYESFTTHPNEGNLVFKALFFLKDSSQKQQQIITIPPYSCAYTFVVNDSIIPLNFSYQLQNNLDISGYLKRGDNNIYFIFNAFHADKSPLDFLENIYFTCFDNLYVYNFQVRADYRTKAVAYGVPPNTRSGIRPAYQIHNFLDTIPKFYCKRSLYYKNSTDSRNYLSYEVNPRNYDSLTYPVSQDELKAFSKVGKQVTHFIYVPKVKKWSTEYPELYSFYSELLNENDQVLQTDFVNVGFEDVAIDHGKYLLPEQKIKIEAIQYISDLSQDYEQLTRELSLLKQHNINTIYVKASEINSQLLDACDLLGLNVILDFNLQELFDVKYKASVRDIVTQIYLSYSNHTSLFAWALRDTENIRDDLNQTLETLQYLGSNPVPVAIITDDLTYIKNSKYKDLLICGLQIADDSNSYEQLQTIEQPVILFDQAGEKSNVIRCMDMVDQGYFKNLLGLSILSVDTDNISNDQKGLTQESIKHLFRNIKMSWIKNTSFSLSIENEYSYHNLLDFNFTATLLRKGEQVAQKSIENVDVPPGNLKIFNFSMDYPLISDEDYELRVSASLKENTTWAKKEYVVSQESIFITKDLTGKLYEISE